MSLWSSFNDIWTPSGRQYNFLPFENQQSQQNQVQTRKKSKQLSRQISQIQQSIEIKQKILEDKFLPKKVQIITHQLQFKEEPPRKSLSILNCKRPESRSQTSRTQSATPMMRRSKKQQKTIEVKDTVGLQIEKCLLYDRYPKEKIKLDYSYIPQRRQRSNFEQITYRFNQVEYKRSITLAKWDQSEKSDELF